MRICLDFQHINKSSNPKDRGAEFNFLTEVDAVILYMNETRKQLELKGHEVFFGLSGFYSERHLQVNTQIKPDLYIAGHVNAGGGSYSLVEIDYNASNKTKALAKLLCEEFVSDVVFKNCISKTVIWELITEEQKKQEQFKDNKYQTRGLACIKGVNCSAILLEPLFIDNADHHNILKHSPKIIADCIVRAIERWK